ncbi:MAG: chromate efflux transporter [Planctomycetota bacterium]|nr:chromate efflux transporter [Planctomycetota bacterium]
MQRDERLLSRLASLAVLFLKLGTLGFGGPAAHLALMEDEVVGRRQWLSRQEFLDLVGVTHLIPGPNSTEMAIHLGLMRAGLPGLVVAGLSFILPAATITAFFAWLYVECGHLPEVAPFLDGVQPVVLAIIFSAVLRLGKTAGKSWRRAGIGVSVALACVFGLGEIWSLLAGGMIGMFILVRLPGARPPAASGGPGTSASGALLGAFLVPWIAAQALLPSVAQAASRIVERQAVPLLDLALFFLKVGAVLYGGGYVLVAFLERQLIHEWGWQPEQLLDAIAIGQFTPGPILSTATFIGYQCAGVPGAVVSTIGIFLPSFFFVLLIRPLMPRLRGGPWRSAFLDAIIVSAVGLMAVALLKLGAAILVDPSSWVVAVAAIVVLLRFKVSAAWVVVGGALLGGLRAALG